MPKFKVGRLPTVGTIEVYRVTEQVPDSHPLVVRVDWYPNHKQKSGNKGTGRCSGCVYEHGSIELKRSGSCKHVQAVRRFIQREKEKAEMQTTLKSALDTILNLE